MANYYDSEPTDAASPSEAESDESMDKSDNKEAKGMSTALIPKSLLMGKEFKPGEEVVFKIVHEYGDEIEIEYASEHKEEEKEESMENDSSEMKSSMDKLESSYS